MTTTAVCFDVDPEVTKAISANEPRVVLERAHYKSKTRLLSLCNALSLDAPAVATIWLLLFANCFGLVVPAGNFTALFCTVWLIYLVDRLVDCLSLTPDMPRSARQMFCARNRILWLVLISIVGLIDAAIICFTLDRVVVLRGICLGSAVAVLGDQLVVEQNLDGRSSQRNDHRFAICSWNIACAQSALGFAADRHFHRRGLFRGVVLCELYQHRLLGTRARSNSE